MPKIIPTIAVTHPAAATHTIKGMPRLGHEIAGGIGADAHKSAVSKGDLSRKAGQDVQPDGGDDGDQYAVADVEQIS